MSTSGTHCRSCVGATRGPPQRLVPNSPHRPRKVAAHGAYVVEARAKNAFRLHDLRNELSLDVDHDLDADGACLLLALCDAGDRGVLVASVHAPQPDTVRYLACPPPAPGD